MSIGTFHTKAGQCLFVLKYMHISRTAFSHTFYLVPNRPGYNYIIMLYSSILDI